MTTAIQQTTVSADLVPEENILVISHLYKSFGKNNVLVDFNLEIKKGESVVVLGKSGSGKSID